MDIKGLIGTPVENPPSTSRVDANSIHPTLATTEAKPIGAQAFSRVWQVGAILQLMVTQVQGKNISLAMSQLGADIPLIQTKTDLPLVPGQQVVARVTGDLSNPSLQLIQLNRTPQDILSQTLRQQLPQQQPLPPVLANLNWAAKQASFAQPPMRQTLPPQVVEMSRALIENLPTSEQLRDPNQLFKAMHLSGQFLEHSLLNRATGQPHFNPEQDVRSQLLRLAQALRQLTSLPTVEKPATTPSQSGQPPVSNPPAATASSIAQAAREAIPAGAKEVVSSTTAEPSLAARTQTAQPQASSSATLAMLADSKLMTDELLAQVDGALARMQSQQLQSIQADQQGRHVWMMELPVRQDDAIDLFDLRIQRDGQGKEHTEQEKSWSMTLAFDLEGLGPMRVKVNLHAETIAANFWAELPDTRRLFHEHIEYLRSRLQHSGLEVSELSCQCGIPPEPPVYLESRLLDERA